VATTEARRSPEATELDDAGGSDMNAEGRRSRATALAVAGILLGVVGIVGYFAIVLQLGDRLPWVRNEAVPNWLLVGIGLALSAVAVVRSRRRLLPGVLLGLNGALALAFAGFLYIASAVPPASGPPIGAPAPGFALVDRGGQTVRLEDFRGAPLLLVFYRGHW